MTKEEKAKVIDGLNNIGLLAAGYARAASDIAHARRQLFLAYLNEGFNEAQALELCKHLAL